MSEYIVESRTLFECAPLTVTLEAWTDEESSPADAECYSPEDVALFTSGEWQYVMLRAVVTVDTGQPGHHEMIIGEDSLSGVEHGHMSDVECDAFEMTGGWSEGNAHFSGSSAWSVVVDAVGQAESLMTALQGQSDALSEIESWVDNFSEAAKAAAHE